MVASSLRLASMPNLRNKGGWFIASLVLGGVVLAGLGLSPWYGLTAAIMFIGGLSAGVFMNLNQTLIQANTPDEMMGRVVSIHTLGFQGIGPLGSLLAGAGASLVSAPVWMAISGAILSGAALLMLATQKTLRRMS